MAAVSVFVNQTSDTGTAMLSSHALQAQENHLPDWRRLFLDPFSRKVSELNENHNHSSQKGGQNFRYGDCACAGRGCLLRLAAGASHVLLLYMYIGRIAPNLKILKNWLRNADL